MPPAAPSRRCRLGRMGRKGCGRTWPENLGPGRRRSRVGRCPGNADVAAFFQWVRRRRAPQRSAPAAGGAHAVSGPRRRRPPARPSDPDDPAGLQPPADPPDRGILPRGRPARRELQLARGRSLSVSPVNGRRATGPAGFGPLPPPPNRRRFRERAEPGRPPAVEFGGGRYEFAVPVTAEVYVTGCWTATSSAGTATATGPGKPSSPTLLETVTPWAAREGRGPEALHPTSGGHRGGGVLPESEFGGLPAWLAPRRFGRYDVATEHVTAEYWTEAVEGLPSHPGPERAGRG